MVSIFTATAKAAMTAVPKLFTRPWTMRMPKFITDCCRQVKKGEIQQVFQGGPVPIPVAFLDPQSGEGKPGVEKQAQAGDELGDHRGHGGPPNPHAQGHHKEDVQADVQNHGNPQKDQRGWRSPPRSGEDWQKNCTERWRPCRRRSTAGIPLSDPKYPVGSAGGPESRPGPDRR